jgi:hypothetical protein
MFQPHADRIYVLYYQPFPHTPFVTIVDFISSIRTLIFRVRSRDYRSSVANLPE